MGAGLKIAAERAQAGGPASMRCREASYSPGPGRKPSSHAARRSGGRLGQSQPIDLARVGELGQVGNADAVLHPGSIRGFRPVGPDDRGRRQLTDESEERAHVLDEDVRHLHGGEVTAAGEFGPGRDVEITLGVRAQ